MAQCGIKRCKREATQAFDMWNPWPDAKGVNRRHYEVCDKHAAEFWPNVPDKTGDVLERMGMPSGVYVERDLAERIAKKAVPC